MATDLEVLGRRPRRAPRRQQRLDQHPATRTLLRSTMIGRTRLPGERCDDFSVPTGTIGRLARQRLAVLNGVVEPEAFLTTSLSLDARAREQSPSRSPRRSPCGACAGWTSPATLRLVE